MSQLGQGATEPLEPPGPGEVLRTFVGPDAVAVWNVGGEFFAVSDICPHQGWVLSEGGVECRDGRAPLVVCPGHTWRFELDTGEAVFRAECLKVYAVEQVEGGILVRDCG